MALCVGGAALGCDGGGHARAEGPCDVPCPGGTQGVRIEETTLAEGLRDGAVVVVTESCETTCLPVVPCRAPNVPVVDADGYRCELMPGYATLGGPDAVDLSFAEGFDPAAASP